MKKQDPYKIIFEDDDILIINKSAGLLSIPDRYDKDLPNLKSMLELIYKKIFVVHRLDKDTSGITVFAKNEESHKSLSSYFENDEIERIYHAVVDGRFGEDVLEIDIPIMADPSKKGRSIPSARGKASLTKVKKIKNFRNSSLLMCKLHTGRHHQIRVHLSAIGKPLLVDNFYGKREHFFVSEVKKNYNLKKGTEESPIISRNTLHAESLKFIHPKSGEEVNFQASYPKDFSATISILEKYTPEI